MDCTRRGASWIGCFPKESAPRVYLTDVYVRTTHRNRGIGSALLAHVRSWAEVHHLEFLLAWPSKASVPFYQRAGFEVSADSVQLTLRRYE